MNARTIALLAASLLIAFVVLGALPAAHAATPAQAVAAPESWAPQWHVSRVDDGVNDQGYHSSIAFNPLNGWPYVSYYEAQNGFLKMAYLSGGGPYSCSDGWNCFKVDGNGASQTGFDNQLGFDSTGHAWIAYSDPFMADGLLAKVDTANLNAVTKQHIVGYNGTGATPPGIDQLRYATLAMWGNSPVTAYYSFNSNSNGNQFTGLFQYSTNSWSEVALIKNGGGQPYTFGYYPSLDWDSVYNTLILAYRGNGNALWNVGHTLNLAVLTPALHTSCPDPTNGTYWDCKMIDGTAETGNFISVHASKNANDPMQVAYYDGTNHQIKYARKVGGNVYCENNFVADPGWECSGVASVAAGSYPGGVSLAVDANGVPTIAYYDNISQANGVLRVARLVGSGGNCGNGSANGKWQCTLADNGSAGFQAKHNVGLNPSIALSPDGRVYVSYYDSDAKALRVANERGAQPTFTKLFNKSTLKVGDSIQATYTIKNHMSVPLTGLQFSDTLSPTLTLLPNGVVSNTCPGSEVTYYANSTFYLGQGLLGPGATCTVKANGVAYTAGQRFDTSGALYANESLTAPGVDTSLFIQGLYRLFLPVIRR